MMRSNIAVIAAALISTAPLAGTPPVAGSQRLTSSRWVQSADTAGGAVGVDEASAGIPLHFIENQGQADADVAFYIRGSEKTIYFTSYGVTFALVKRRAESNPRPRTHEGSDSTDFVRQEPLERWVVKLDFVRADPGVRPHGEDLRETIYSYFKGRPEDWRTAIPTYGRVVYPDLWPGITLVYSGSVNSLKYQFIVKPGANPNRIRLAYRGTADVTLAPTGVLRVSTPYGGFEDARPYAYQEVAGTRVEVPVGYALQERSPDGDIELSFDLGPHDTTLPLILDPTVLVYCGYIGGNGDDLAMDIAVDGSGNVYLAGWTESSEATFPVQVGPDLTYNVDQDVFVAKVDSTGTGLIYCGYIGGYASDYGYGIAVDSAGNAYVTGETGPTDSDFPAVTGPDLTHNGFYDAFIACVDASGSDLVYCGFIGGGVYDCGWGISADAVGNAHVTGITASPETSFPVLVGPDLTYNGNKDAFVTKVSNTGAALYCGYVGGVQFDEGRAITVDGLGNVYLTGRTHSPEASFPIQIGPELTFEGGEDDAFVAKVNTAAEIVYCGYVGGTGGECGHGISVDGSGRAYVAGITSSTETSFPLAVGPDLTHNGARDAFVARVNPSGSGMDYCGYIGGADEECGEDIAVVGSGSAYITGYTQSDEVTFPVLSGPDLTFNGRYDAFVAKVNAYGASVEYCGYVGGTSNDYGYGITVDDSNNAYVTGYTGSSESSFPVQGGPDLSFGGNVDVFVTKVSDSLNAIPTAFIDDMSPNPATLGEEVYFTGHGEDIEGSIVAYNWRSDLDGQLSDQSSFSTSSLSPGWHSIYFKVQDDSTVWSEETTGVLAVAVNVPPTAFIDDITPNPAHPGEEVSFHGHGEDVDGVIVVYSWASSIDGQLSAEASFSTSSLSIGLHTVYFTVQDDSSAWSEEVSATLEIMNLPPTAFIDSITPNPADTGEEVFFGGHGEDPDGSIVVYSWRASPDSQLSDEASFSTSGFSPGSHQIFFKVQDNSGAWSEEVQRNLGIIVGFDLCGDADHSGNVDYADVVFLEDYLYDGSAAPPCYEEADVDDYQIVTTHDLIRLHECVTRGACQMVCPPGHSKLYSSRQCGGECNYLKLVGTVFPAGQSTVTIRFELASTVAIHSLVLPLRVRVADGIPEGIGNIQIAPTFSNWSLLTRHATIDSANGKVLFTFGHYHENSVGPFPSYTEVATVDISMTPSGVDREITAWWDPFGPVHNGEYSHYPMLVEPNEQVWTPALVPCCNHDGITGDVNYDDDEGPNIIDLTYLLRFLFNDGSWPPCLEEADVNGDGVQGNIADLTFLVARLFGGGDAPAPCP